MTLLETPVLDVMMRRRSIRKFDARPIAEEQVTLLLQAAFSGPSSTNSRPWHFIVVRDPDRRRALADLHDYTAMLVHAPLVMPAHVRTALTAVNLSLPVTAGRLALGTWQGLYVWEHRTAPHHRRVVAHYVGE